jgi:flagellar basal-body rod protein FlgG
MISQQNNVDTISNNLANINTVGYKKESAQFKSLLYQTIQEQSYDNTGEPKPYGVQVGLGVRTAAIASQYTQGVINDTGNDFDLAINGKGFFMVQTPNGETAYTRNGSFQVAVGANASILATAEGNPVLDINGEPIVLEKDYDASEIVIDAQGELLYPDDAGDLAPIGMQIGLAQFNNPSGLQKLGNSLLGASDASGTARIEANDSTLDKSSIKQGALEASNVQAVDEIVNLIVAQRAYEMNSKIITATDEMLQQANNLR